MKIQFVDKIPDYIHTLLEKEYAIYEAQKRVESHFKYFYILAKDHEKIVGVLTGYTLFSEVCIEELLVIESYRNQGFGRNLLLYSETYFRDKGFTNINLVTNEFQAPEFYKKCGYTLEFIRENKEFPMFSKYFFIKWFNSNDSDI